MSEKKDISLSIIKDKAKSILKMDHNIMDSMIEKASLDMANRVNHTIAFLVLLRAVYDNISIRQVVNNYEIWEKPIEAHFIKEFKDVRNDSFKFEVESQMRLVKRKQRIRISDSDFERIKTSILQELSEAFKGKQVENETNSSEQ